MIDLPDWLSDSCDKQSSCLAAWLALGKAESFPLSSPTQCGPRQSFLHPSITAFIWQKDKRGKKKKECT